MLIRRVVSERSFQNLPPPSPSSGFSGEEESGSESKQVVVSEKSTAAKRPAEDTATGEGAKKAKRTHGSCIKRFWSEEDEIAILKGLIDFKSERKSDPLADLNAFYDFIRKDLLVEATRAQLVSKISKLKNKYRSSKGKKRRNFSDPHERRAHDLAKLVWGNEKARREKAVGGAAAAEESGEGEKLTAAAKEGGGMSVEERMLVAGRKVYEMEGGKVEGGEEWRKLRVEELELYRKEMEVRAAQSKVRIAQAKLVLDGIKRGKITFF